MPKREEDALGDRRSNVCMRVALPFAPFLPGVAAEEKWRCCDSSRVLGQDASRFDSSAGSATEGSATAGVNVAVSSDASSAGERNVDTSSAAEVVSVGLLHRSPTVSGGETVCLPARHGRSS